MKKMKKSVFSFTFVCLLALVLFRKTAFWVQVQKLHQRCMNTKVMIDID